MLENIKTYRVVLGSQSPRRQQLLKGLELEFDIMISDLDEKFPPNLIREEIPLFLSAEKAGSMRHKLSQNYLLITADTVVCIDNHVLNKPVDREEAIGMISNLSGKTHEVYTGVTVSTANLQHSFYEKTSVTFRELNMEEIMHYIDHYRPFDKAGSYGVQEWLGYVAISRIEGCFFNVMGLPLSRLYAELKSIPRYENG